MYIYAHAYIHIYVGSSRAKNRFFAALFSRFTLMGASGRGDYLTAFVVIPRTCINLLINAICLYIKYLIKTCVLAWLRVCAYVCVCANMCGVRAQSESYQIIKALWPLDAIKELTTRTETAPRWKMKCWQYLPTICFSCGQKSR